MNRNSDLLRTVALIIGAFVLALIVAFTVPIYWFLGPPPWAPSLTVLVLAKLVFSTFTPILLLALLVTYVRIYRDLPNRFTLSLMLFTLTLLLYALTANPLVSVILFGFRYSIGLGPFTFLPDLFASIAVVILYYQSQK